jgi:iron complex outermembrane receptor protein
MASSKIRSVPAAAFIAFAFAVAFPYEVFAQIDEVVVTTRRREESLQDVPISVSAITSEQIERQGISDLADVVKSQPSVQFDQAYGPSDNRITIRGLSNTRGRSNVAFLVDGIDVTTENLIAAGSGLLANRRLLTDVERIEIVKGPQSALYGRAAFAGAISYVTKEPGDEFEGRVSVDLGDYGRRTIDAAVGGPITDTLGIRLTGVQYNQDGYYTNSMSGEDVGGSSGYGAAFTAVWRPDDMVKVKGRIEYSDESYDPRAAARIDGLKTYYLPESGKTIVRPVITPPGPNGENVQNSASTSNNLYNFGVYCPKRDGFDIAAINAYRNGGGRAGFCLPGVIKDADGVVIAHSEDPLTGKDYPGTDTETFRASLIATFDLGYGLFSSYTGWTDFDSTDRYDQDYQASSAPDIFGNGPIAYQYDANGRVIAGRRDTLLGAQEANADSSTQQFSQEFRFETQWDSPFKLTGGVLFWQDKRELLDRNWITACGPYTRLLSSVANYLDEEGNTVPAAAGGNLRDPVTGDLVLVPGICDGTDNTRANYQDYRRQVGVLDPNFQDLPQGMYASLWDARTRHLSFYGMVEWAITDDLKLTFETRFVDEEFTLTKPASSSCTEIAFASGATGPNSASVEAPWSVEERTYCDAERVVFANRAGFVGPGQFPIASPLNPVLSWRYLEGSTYSNYNTPKVTLDWEVTDSAKLFFSYGFAQKPGGINQLAGGGGAPAPTLEEERFEPEKLKAYELGLKSDFEAAGYWRLNGSLFLQDYSDKQVGVQIVSPEGVSQPRVVNASGAQVWGLELDATWQPTFMEGLTLAFSGTLLDAEYTDWIDDSRNLVKAAAYGDCPIVYKLGNQEFTDINDWVPSDTNGSGTITAADAQPTPFCRFNYSGNKLERTPKQSYAASIIIQRPFLDSEFEYLFELNGSWQDERWAEPENMVKLTDYARVDLRLGLTSDRWEVIGYVENLFDDDRIITAGSGPDFGEQVTHLGFTAGFGTTHYFATLPDPRVFGVRASYRFGPGR